MNTYWTEMFASLDVALGKIRQGEPDGWKELIELLSEARDAIRNPLRFDQSVAWIRIVGTALGNALDAAHERRLPDVQDAIFAASVSMH